METNNNIGFGIRNFLISKFGMSNQRIDIILLNLNKKLSDTNMKDYLNHESSINASIGEQCFNGICVYILENNL
jgi:hypothetical protein